ncbi:MAG: M48 family metallopeptidase [Desulfatibacillum sp.]|nr:M48 family metallopeptidase [Desulfatibacillum sp.]
MPKIKYIPRYSETNYNISKTSPLKSYFILSFGITAFCLLVYLLLGVTVSFLAPHIPVSLEAKIGSMYESFGEGDRMEDESARLQALLDSLVPLLEPEDRELDYRVVVSESPVVNALALPGGRIVVYSGLLKEIDDEQELTFVLGHELGHFHHRDHLKRLGRGLAGMTLVVTLLGADSGASDFVLQRVQNLESKFSRAQEKDADMFGVELLHKKYGNAKGAVEFMDKLAQEERFGKPAYYFASHPHPQSRKDYLKDKLEDMK